MRDRKKERYLKIKEKRKDKRRMKESNKEEQIMVMRRGYRSLEQGV